MADLTPPTVILQRQAVLELRPRRKDEHYDRQYQAVYPASYEWHRRGKLWRSKRQRKNTDVAGQSRGAHMKAGRRCEGDGGTNGRRLGGGGWTGRPRRTMS